jgi:LysR family nitrogen assimilation transcriptional regulator
MDLRQIRYFVAVYEEGSFSRAAQREHCTQPGISVQIQKLETELNQRLFERQARGVTPTLAGRHFYTCCVGVLDGLRMARQRMLDLAGNAGGALRIGVAPTLCLNALPRVLPQFLADNPYVEVRVSEAFSGTLTGWVVDGELDVAIVTEPSQQLGLTTTPFFRDELVIVMGADRARRLPRPRTWEDLRGLDLILPSEKHGLRQVVRSQAGLTSARGRTVEVDGMLATLELVRTSDWITVLPVCACLEKVERGDLVAERFADGAVPLDFYLIHTSSEPVSVAAQSLLSALRHAAGQIASQWRSLGNTSSGPRGTEEKVTVAKRRRGGKA